MPNESRQILLADAMHNPAISERSEAGGARSTDNHQDGVGEAGEAPGAL